MKYLVFNAEQEALEAEEQISRSMGFAKAGINAKTKQPEPNKQSTIRWAVPQQIADGRWVFPSPNDEGIESENNWWPEVMDTI